MKESSMKTSYKIIIAVVLFILILPRVSSSATFKINKPPYLYKLNSGLMHHYTFDGKDMANGVAQDIAGTNNPGNLVNISTSTFYTAGKIGQGLNFDGVDDYVVIPALTYGTSVITISMWLDWTTYANNDDLLLESSINFNNNEGTFLINPNDSGTGKFGVGIRDGNYFSESMTRPSVGFHHFTFVIDNSTVAGDIKMFVDGVEQVTTRDLDIKTQSGNFASHPLYLMSRAGSSLIAAGKLDDLRIYNRELTQTEITQLYNFGLARFGNTDRNALTSGLVGHWTFDGKDVPNGRANDVSGNGNHGSLTNIATSTFYTAGKIGQGLNFDGVDDYVDLGNITTLTVGSPFSVSWWEKIISTGGTFNDRFALNMSNGLQFYTTRTNDSSYNNLTWGPESGTNNPRSTAVPSIDSSIGVWKHFVLTGTDPTSSVEANYTLYVDGVSAAVTEGGNYGAIGTINRIGDAVGASRPSNAVFDDIRIYNKTLSATEVKQLYNLGSVKIKQ